MINAQNKASTSHSIVKSEQGLTLLATLVVVIVVGVVALSGMRLTEISEVLSGNSIQRSRALHAAEGGLSAGESIASVAAQQRKFASAGPVAGIFSKDTVADLWWRDDTFVGATELADDAFPGVLAPPKFVVEELGSYVSDGGSGIISLDRGGTAYGKLTKSGREVVLYRVQTLGVGSSSNSKAVIESMYVENL